MDEDGARAKGVLGRRTLLIAGGTGLAVAGIGAASWALTRDGTSRNDVSVRGSTPPPDAPPQYAEPKLAGTLDGHDGAVYTAALVPGGNLLVTGGYDQRLRLWDVVRPRPLGDFDAPGSAVRFVAFTPDGKTMVSGGSHDVMVWDVAQRRRLETIPRTTSHLTTMALAPDGRTLATATTDGRVRLWSIPGGRLLHTFPSLPGAGDQVAGTSTALTFTPDGRFLAAGREKQLWVLDVPKRERLHVLTGELDLGSRNTFAPDGRTLFAGDLFAVRVWDVVTGSLKHVFEISDEVGGATRLAPDGRTLVMGDQEGRLWQWDAPGRRLATTFTDMGEIIEMEFSPGGGTLAVSTTRVASADPPAGAPPARNGREYVVHLWDVRRQRIGRTLHGVFPDRVTRLAFGPGGRTLITAGREGKVRVWRL